MILNSGFEYFRDNSFEWLARPYWLPMLCRHSQASGATRLRTQSTRRCAGRDQRDINGTGWKDGSVK
jgi:hypothetical protein